MTSSPLLVQSPEAEAQAALALRSPLTRSTVYVILQVAVLLLLLLAALPFASILFILVRLCVCIPLPNGLPIAVKSKLRPPKPGAAAGWPSGEGPGMGEDRPCATADSADWTTLHAGIRWFARFDPAKKTVVYVHGWEPGTTARGFRETFNWRKNTLFPEQGVSAAELPDVDAAALWTARGWNIGVFYWNQFSDDTLPEAEAKIHTAQGGGGMRWQRRAEDGGTSAVIPPAGEVPCVAMQLADALAPLCAARAATAQLRLVGHSLGGQLVLEACRRLLDSGRLSVATPPAHGQEGGGDAQPAPLRLALLDPFFSPGRKAYLDDLTGVQRAEQNLALLRRALPSTVIECYRTSCLGDPPFGSAMLPVFGASSRCLHRPCAFAYVAPPQQHPLQFRSRHISAYSLYFLSIAAAPLEGNGTDEPTDRPWANCMHPGASDATIRARMGPLPDGPTEIAPHRADEAGAR